LFYLGYNHFCVEFCLQDVETNGAVCRRSYSHSSVCSIELIDSKRVIYWILGIFINILVNEVGNTLQVSHPEKNELRQGIFLFV